jgi:hypothetical protein
VGRAEGRTYTFGYGTMWMRFPTPPDIAWRRRRWKLYGAPN